jgi:hypothetical protein
MQVTLHAALFPGEDRQLHMKAEGPPLLNEAPRRAPAGHPRILAAGKANPPLRLTQEESFRMAGCESMRPRPSGTVG